MIPRQSNFELLRIFSMLLVVLLHANYFALGNISPEEVAQFPVTAAVRIFCEQACIVCVNVFVMISGWFGIKASQKGLCAFLFQVMFLVGVVFGVALVVGQPIDADSAAKAFYFGSYYWFVTAYIILYVLSPVLNAFMEHASYRSALTVVVAFFAVELFFGRIRDAGLFNHGYSALSFVGLYLLARFLRLHARKVTQWRARRCFALYLLLTLLPAGLSYFVEGCLGNEYMPIYYDSPAVILAAMFLVLGFARLSIQSRVVNRVAASVFAIYIVHLHPVVVPHYVGFLNHLYASVPLPLYMLGVLLGAVVMGAVCVMLDKVRLFCWKQICRGKVASWLAKY